MGVIGSWIRIREERIYRRRKRLKLAKTDFTILASNCNGSFMYHDMGLPYLTPMVNLSMRMDDFVTMLENLR